MIAKKQNSLKGAVNQLRIGKIVLLSIFFKSICIAYYLSKYLHVVLLQCIFAPSN